jgi:hypothetical protein
VVALEDTGRTRVVEEEPFCLVYPLEKDIIVQLIIHLDFRVDQGLFPALIMPRIAKCVQLEVTLTPYTRQGVRTAGKGHTRMKLEPPPARRVTTCFIKD